ncbi:MAG TPA: two-component regulator propeller domain-containing protein, partial [Bacteroidia bacterium]|nr:two-component regulator propeller domain-containing protein [Bacteroidia bacterium]
MNRTIAYCILFSFLLFSPGRLISQSYNFRIYTDDDGLAQSYVYAIDQAENGFLNISTGEGFCSFDGSKFKTFTKDDSLAENFISTHFEDSRGITWLGHYQNGISYRKKGVFYKLKTSLNLSSRITCFAEDKNRNIWVSTQSKGVFKIDTAFNFLNVSNSEATNASAITIDDENKILLGTNYGLFVYKEISGRIHLDCAVEGFENKTIRNIIPVDKNRNSFWISVQGEGIFLVRKIGNCYASILKITSELGLENYTFSSLFSDRDNDLWVGTSGEGLRKIHFQNIADKSYFTVSKITEVNGLPNKYILSVFQDREG